MKPIEFSTIQHEQSGTPVTGITILGRTFVWADKRGHTSRKPIDDDYARRIIEQFPPKMNNPYPGKITTPVLYSDKLRGRYELIWSSLTSGAVELRIFSCGAHAYTSEPLEVEWAQK